MLTNYDQYWPRLTKFDQCKQTPLLLYDCILWIPISSIVSSRICLTLSDEGSDRSSLFVLSMISDLVAWPRPACLASNLCIVWSFNLLKVRNANRGFYPPGIFSANLTSMICFLDHYLLEWSWGCMIPISFQYTSMQESEQCSCEINVVSVFRPVDKSST